MNATAPATQRTLEIIDLAKITDAGFYVTHPESNPNTRKIIEVSETAIAQRGMGNGPVVFLDTLGKGRANAQAKANELGIEMATEATDIAGITQCGTVLTPDGNLLRLGENAFNVNGVPSVGYEGAKVDGSKTFLLLDTNQNLHLDAAKRIAESKGRTVNF